MSHASIIVAIDPAHNCLVDGDLNQAIAWEMEPFDENGEWFRAGSRWDWWTVGGRYSGKFCGENIILVKDLSPNKYLAYQEKEFRDCYLESLKEKDQGMRTFIYGVNQGESEADYVKRKTQGSWFPASFAFLKDRKWHETARLGFFGCTTATECERDGKLSKPEMKCLVKDEQTGSQIVSWNSDDETWRLKFHDRFIKHLSPDTQLVVVDYHV